MIPTQYVCRDVIARELEEREILYWCPPGKISILDVGCGCGKTLSLFDTGQQCFGLEPNAGMRLEAQQLVPDALIWPLKIGATIDREFDYIYTQRALIQLSSWEEQQEAIEWMGQHLVPKGRLVLVEPNRAGLDRLNQARDRLGLSKIVPPRHTQYLPDPEMWPAKIGPAFWYYMSFFGGFYAFLSRGLNARLAADLGREPDYDTPLTRLGLRPSPLQAPWPSQYHCSVWTR